MQLGHVVCTAPDLCGHVEYPAPTDSGELGTVADKRDGRSGFGGDGEEGVGGVLVEHPGLVHDYPFTPRQHSIVGRAGEGAPGVGVSVARV